MNKLTYMEFDQLSSRPCRTYDTLISTMEEQPNHSIPYGQTKEFEAAQEERSKIIEQYEAYIAEMEQKLNKLSIISTYQEKVIVITQCTSINLELTLTKLSQFDSASIFALLFNAVVPAIQMSADLNINITADQIKSIYDFIDEQERKVGSNFYDFLELRTKLGKVAVSGI